MKTKIIFVMAVALCIGCETLTEIGSPSVCSHENMTVYRSNVFPDGQHYLFKGGKLAALANVKDGYAEGKFEIYYPTGIFKYKGSLDNRDVELYEQITGEPFVKGEATDVLNRIEQHVKECLAGLQ